MTIIGVDREEDEEQATSTSRSLKDSSCSRKALDDEGVDDIGFSGLAAKVHGQK